MQILYAADGVKQVLQGKTKQLASRGINRLIEDHFLVLFSLLGGHAKFVFLLSSCS